MISLAKLKEIDYIIDFSKQFGEILENFLPIDGHYYSIVSPYFCTIEFTASLTHRFMV